MYNYKTIESDASFKVKSTDIPNSRLKMHMRRVVEWNCSVINGNVAEGAGAHGTVQVVFVLQQPTFTSRQPKIIGLGHSF